MSMPHTILRNLLLAATALWALAGCAQKPEPDMVYQLFQEAAERPESFDAYLEQHHIVSTEPFEYCVNRVRDNLVHHARLDKARKGCASLAPQYRGVCEQYDAFKISAVLSGMEAAVNHTLRYDQTMAGVSHIAAKTKAGREVFEGVYGSIVPVYHSVLSCP